ncbi:MAG: hypothetical protein AABX11_00190 [Nanoarchaeota archaeon]
MKFNFKKIASVLAGTVMLSSTLAFAAAANYPAPFVNNGNADVAVVYGSAPGADMDLLAVTDIVVNLQAKLAAQTATSGSTGSDSVTGEAVSLSSGSTKIWLNTSLNTALTTLTKTDLPTVLGEYTFSGNVDSKLTSTIAIGSSDKVTFAKQPSSNDDPVIGIALGATNVTALYTSQVTMPAINFTSADSEGETIKLFGREFVVSTATDATSLVLFSSAKEVSLSAGASDSVPSATVSIDGVDYTVALVTGTSTTATVSVNGESKEITEGASKKIGGIDVAVKSVTESTALNTVTASLLVGSQKITFTGNTQVLVGSDDDPVDGTYVTFTGTTGALTGLSVAVYAPDSSNDAILPGEAFVDPVFGSFKVDFSGLSVPMNSSARDDVKIDKSGDKGMALTMTDSDGVTKSFDFAYNATTTFLGDTNSYRINTLEGSTLYENNYTVIGNEDYGHLLQVTRIYNNTGSDYSKDAVTFKDVISGDSYSIDATSEGAGRLTVDGRQYTVAYSGSGDSGTATLKYPTSDSSATQYVLFPSIQTKSGSLVQLIEPKAITLSTQTGFMIPDGDGYTTIATPLTAGSAPLNYSWTVGGTSLNTTGTSSVVVMVGTLGYNFTLGASNVTTVRLATPVTNTSITAPAVVVVEGKDDSSTYNAVVVALEAAAAGTSTDPLGVNDVYFTSQSRGLWDSVSLQSDSDISQSVDWYGTLVTEDSNTASQKIVTISNPNSQVYANVYVGEDAASISSSGSTGDGTVKELGSVQVIDTQASATSNLIVVGGSCVNKVAAELLFGASAAQCGAAWEQKTGIAAGSFLVESFARNGKVATLVAGYNADDTRNAAKVLKTQTIDTTAGKKYKSTSATAVSLVTA